jgi:protein-disulfide isomerase
MIRVHILFIYLFICTISADVLFANDIEDNSSILKLVDGDHHLGNIQAKVTIIEYSSLSCPGCSSFHEGIFAKIKKNYISTNKVLYIFRDYPVNEPALYGAIFANCFNDNYFDIIDILFKSQTKWAFRKDFKQMLKNIARLSGYSTDKINSCFDDKRFADTLQKKAYDDMRILNINQTPTIYINQIPINSIQNYDNFVKIIDNHLSK